MKTTLKMSVPAIVEFLKSVGTSSQFVSMETVTTPKLKKTCPFVGVVKKAIVNGWINIDYKAAVERKVAKAMGVPASDVEYVPGETWHTAVMVDGKASPVRVNKTKDDGKFYMFYFHRKTKEAGYFDAAGKEIAYEDLKEHFYARSDSEYKPAVRCVTLNNLKSLKARGLVIKNKKHLVA